MVLLASTEPGGAGSRRGSSVQSDPRIWAGVELLLRRAPKPSDLVAHGLAVFAARRWRDLGRLIPDEFVDEEHRAVLGALTTPILLERVRAASDDELLIVKGPEVASRYPDRTLRGFRDIDLIARKPEHVHQALQRAGAVPMGDPDLYRNIHHLRPLGWPDLPLVIEIHSRPKWISQLEPPPTDDLFTDARPADVEVDGFLAPTASRHAVLLAVHSWAHEPLRRLRDLVDVAAVVGEADPGETTAVARAWGVERLWATTADATEAVLLEGQRPLSLRLWAQHLNRVRSRTVLEHHLERWLSNFWILPAPRAAAGLPALLLTELGPEEGETWSRKGRRTALALRNAVRRRSEHDAELRRRSF